MAIHTDRQTDIPPFLFLFPSSSSPLFLDLVFNHLLLLIFFSTLCMGILPIPCMFLSVEEGIGLWHWTYRWLWAAMLLRIKPRSSALNCWAISLAQGFTFFWDSLLYARWLFITFKKIMISCVWTFMCLGLCIEVRAQPYWDISFLPCESLGLNEPNLPGLTSGALNHWTILQVFVTFRNLYFCLDSSLKEKL